MAAEQAKRVPVIQARAQRQKALEVAVVASQSRVNVDSDRMPTVTDGFDARQHRMTSIQTLYSHGTVDKVVLEQARGDLSDAKDRQASVLTSIGDDMRNLALAKIDAAKFDSETRVELDQAISANQREIDELTSHRRSKYWCDRTPEA